MDSKDEAIVFLLMIVAVAILMIGLIINAHSELKKQAIKKGFAQYSGITGEWEWKSAPVDKKLSDNAKIPSMSKYVDKDFIEKDKKDD